jgi:regulator of protease activity HflC (stomatin/prohibitin superfamily)
VQRIIKILIPLLIVSITLPGCSSMSPQARVERAHRKYVHQARREHQKQTAQAIKEANRPLRQPPSMSDPQITAVVESNGDSGQ